MAEVLKNKNMVFICADSNGLTSQRLMDYLELVADQRKVLLIPDESHSFKNPKAQRTKFMLRLAKACPFRRILSGTPLTSPFDLWSQFQIVDPAIFNERFIPFKTKYGIFETKFFGPRAVKVVTGYKNLEDLKAKIEPHCSWRTYDETFPNNPGVLPPEKAYFEMSPEYTKAYNELRKEYILQLEKGEVLVNNPLVMILRLAQISRGFVMTDNGEQVIPGENNAAKRLLHEIEKRNTEKVVVWCRHRSDIDTVMRTLAEAEIVCVRHDGAITEEERAANLVRFQTDPLVRVIVGTPSTGGVGKNFSAGSTIIFYSHSFNLIERVQAFNRVRGISQDKPVQQVDICAIGTVDERCMVLLSKRVDVITVIQDKSVLLNMLKTAPDEQVDWTPSSVSHEGVGVAESVLSEDSAAEMMEQLIKNQNGEL
jgi:SNF2 family DNA or RNA helicase